MPLMIMSPTIAEMDSPNNRKRTHDEFSGDASDVPVKTEPEHQGKMQPPDIGTSTSIPQRLARNSPPVQSSPAALTEAGSSTPGGGSTSPNTPTRQPLQPVNPAPQNAVATSPTTIFPPPKTILPTGQGPPAKRKKLTPAEKQAKAAEDAAKRVEREAQKLVQEEKKAARQAEKDRRQAELEAKKKEREQKKLEAEQKEREKREEAERKSKNQLRIGFYFKPNPAAPTKNTQSTLAKVQAEARSPSPAAAQTDYAKVALPFFVHNNVTLAKNPFLVDEETQEAKTSILTDYLAGKRSPVPTKPYDAVSALHLADAAIPRGKSYPCVRDLMSDQEGGISNPINLIAESLKLPSKRSLKTIPMKQFSFHEDVRPGYYGTVTSVQSVATLQRMARNPVAKDLPLNYDYDSEAEWVHGDEEEDEGVDEMTDDEEEEEDDKSINEFLDDSEDVQRGHGPLMPVSSMEPETSGLCFEDRKRRNPNPQMYKFRMEFIIPNLEHHHSIDPFSSAYWPSDAKTTPSTSPGQAVKTKSAKAQGAERTSNGAMPPPPTPKASTADANTSAPAADLIPAHLMDEFKAMVLEFKFLPKSGMIPTLAHKFDKCKKAQIQATLECVAEKPKKNGDWQLKQGI